MRPALLRAVNSTNVRFRLVAAAVAVVAAAATAGAEGRCDGRAGRALRGCRAAGREYNLGVSLEARGRAAESVAAYRRVKHAFPRETSLVLLYALHGAIIDTPWTALSPATRDRLRRKAGS